MTYERLMEFTAAINQQLHAHYGTAASKASWHLTQVIKIMEEVGELSEQVLAAEAMQRADKAHEFSPETLGAEIADVLITTLQVAYEFNVDVAAALEQKMTQIEQRYM